MRARYRHLSTKLRRQFFRRRSRFFLVQSELTGRQMCASGAIFLPVKHIFEALRYALAQKESTGTIEVAFAAISVCSAAFKHRIERRGAHCVNQTGALAPPPRRKTFLGFPLDFGCAAGSAQALFSPWADIGTILRWRRPTRSHYTDISHAVNMNQASLHITRQQHQP